jgi:hypothetical protein
LQLSKENSHSREYLYLMNISALNRLKLGDVKGALSREQEIEAQLSLRSYRDWHLEYINALNLARLYRHLGDWEQAERYFHRAFAGSMGVRSKGDLLSFNYYLGQTFAERGQYDKAFEYWLRGALHWVADETPEALPPRVIRLITNRAAEGENSVEAVSLSWLYLLESCVKRGGFLEGRHSIDCSDRPVAPAFWDASLRGECGDDRYELAIGERGWSVLIGTRKRMPCWAGPSHAKLRTFLYLLLRATSSAMPDVSAIFIDSRLGSEIPCTARELLEVCLRLRVPRMTFAGRTVSFDEIGYSVLKRSAIVTMSSAVERVAVDDGCATVFFKRYLLPISLSSDESHAVAMIAGGSSPETITMTLGSFEKGWSLLEGLQEKRIVDISWPDSVLC